MPPHLERTKATGNDLVSMKSGLEGRNNVTFSVTSRSLWELSQ